MESFYVGYNKYVLVVENEIPSMCAEFDPGPSEDDLFPEYYNIEVIVKIVDMRNDTIKDIRYKEMKEYYKKIQRKRERISFWRTLKYLKYIES